MTQELVTRNENGAVAPGMFDSIEQMTAALTVAEKLSQSNILPDTFKGKPGDVLIALDMAQRLHMNPLMVMQGIVIVHGRPTFSGQFYGALITSSGQFTHYDYVETETDETVKELGGIKNRVGKIVAVRPNGDKVEGPEVSYRMAVKEGWATRSGSKWQTMPALMLRYRAASWFVRTCCPEAAMGLYEENEAADIPPITVRVERPEETVAPGVRETVEAEAIEPEDEGVSYDDAAEVMNQTIEEPTPDPKAVEGMCQFYAAQIRRSKTTKELNEYVKVAQTNSKNFSDEQKKRLNDAYNETKEALRKK